MRVLFEIDSKDYRPEWPRFVRPSVRAVIPRGSRICLVHSQKYDYWKFPGGGPEAGENDLQALIRETKEEAGLTVIPSSVKEYGHVPRLQADSGNKELIFEQDNRYYLCEAEAEKGEQCLDAYEADEGFTPETADPRTAILANTLSSHGPKDKRMLYREARVLETLIREGYFDIPENRRGKTMFLCSSPELFGQDLLDGSNGFITELKKRVPENVNMLYIASSPDDPAANDRYSLQIKNAFEAAGIRPASFSVLDARTLKDAGALLAKSGLLFLAGGHVPTQNAFFQKLSLKEKLNDWHGVIVSCSAGTMNSACLVYAVPEEEGEAASASYSRWLPGLSLTDTRVLPHWQTYGGALVDGQRLIEDIILKDSFLHRFLALPDGSYILSENGKETVYGQAYTVEDGEIRPYTDPSEGSGHPAF